MERQPQRTVYILKSRDMPPRYYTGLTSNLAGRLEAHNAGRCVHKAKYRPWARVDAGFKAIPRWQLAAAGLDVVVKCADETQAAKFEKYLKSGSCITSGSRTCSSKTNFATM